VIQNSVGERWCWLCQCQEKWFLSAVPAGLLLRKNFRNGVPERSVTEIPLLIPLRYHNHYSISLNFPVKTMYNDEKIKDHVKPVFLFVCVVLFLRTDSTFLYFLQLISDYNYILSFPYSATLLQMSGPNIIYTLGLQTKIKFVFKVSIIV
jgi:hypothetical protein